MGRKGMQKNVGKHVRSDYPSNRQIKNFSPLSILLERGWGEVLLKERKPILNMMAIAITPHEFF
ncbi:MAG: hypothetical protein A3H98_13890 [Bacteroidetes bacterium RIFCSPLOWO2_02_FULL_36_8]|nr:MAG: hypothetical protein A3H98_13890 [Bacteroidetes bacterium RIFCSPLOWO2_02_FULL_36_8]